MLSHVLEPGSVVVCLSSGSIVSLLLQQTKYFTSQLMSVNLMHSLWLILFFLALFMFFFFYHRFSFRFGLGRRSFGCRRRSFGFSNSIFRSWRTALFLGSRSFWNIILNFRSTFLNILAIIRIIFLIINIIQRYFFNARHFFKYIVDSSSIKIMEKEIG